MILIDFAVFLAGGACATILLGWGVQLKRGRHAA
jgi:hypothetical protein